MASIRSALLPDYGIALAPAILGWIIGPERRGFRALCSADIPSPPDSRAQSVFAMPAAHGAVSSLSIGQSVPLSVSTSPRRALAAVAAVFVARLTR